jgi:hypothetical protein
MHKIQIIFSLYKPQFTLPVQKKRSDFFWSVLLSTNMAFQRILPKIEILKTGSNAVESGFLENV